MKYRAPLFIWAMLSPVAWIVMLIIVSGSHTEDLVTAFVIAFLTLGSLFGSFAAFVSWSKSNHFFKSIENLEDEIETYQKAKREYIRMVENKIVVDTKS